MGKAGILHFSSLLLLLLNLALVLTAGISFRGQGFDILLSFTPFVSALVVLFTRFKKLGRAGKVYFIAAPLLNLLAAPVYLFGTVFFPLQTLAKAGPYVARERMGVLSPPAVNLIRQFALFEQIISPNLRYDVEYPPSRSVRLVLRADSVGVVLPQYRRADTVVFFRR